MNLTPRTLSLLVVGSLGLGVAGWALSAGAEPPSTPPEPLGLAAPGRVEPIGEERELGPQVPGLLAKVHVDENDRVEVGQILAELDRADLEAERAAAVANLSLRRAERQRLINGARPEERQAGVARLSAADAALALAEKEHGRNLKLWQDSVLTEAEHDRSRAALEAAKARQKEAQEQLRLLEAPARADELAMADAQLAVGEARLLAVEAALAKTYVKAPIAGTILKRHRRAGETVSTQPPTPLFVIGDLSRRAVRAEVDELDVARIHLGDTVEVVADAYGPRRFQGKVVRVGQRVGGKSVHTDRPDERQDRKVLEVLIELEPNSELPIGLRVDVFAQATR